MMATPLVIKTAETPEEIQAALEIRKKVFVREQEIPDEMDSDGLDEEAIHVIALHGERVVATGRLVMESAEHGVLARIAVLPELRGAKLGQKVVLQLEAEAQRAGAKLVSLHPHRGLETFYARLGYHTIEGTSVVGEHELITMEKDLTGTGEAS